MKREETYKIKVGNITIGGSNKIVIQSMTNTKTSNISKTLKQINDLYNVGAELVRVSIFDNEDSNSLKEIIKKSPCPIVADIHFNPLFAINAIKDGVSKIRLNPGNIEDEKDLIKIIDLCKKYKTAIRIGVNSGSLPKDILRKYGLTSKAMILTTKRYLDFFEKHNFNNIVLSLKASSPILSIESYKIASKKFKYPLHLGITESGTIQSGTIKSCVGLAPLIYDGIGDTIRISLTGDPVEEVKVCKKMLNSLDLYPNLVDIISCPTCGRLNFDMEPIVKEIENYTSNMNFPLKIAILGCSVNGPGEAKEADIGISGGNNCGYIFENGKIIKNVPSNELLKELKKLINKYYLKYKRNQK